MEEAEVKERDREELWGRGRCRLVLTSDLIETLLFLVAPEISSMYVYLPVCRVSLSGFAIPGFA